jgi:hypothetical protein
MGNVGGVGGEGVGVEGAVAPWCWLVVPMCVPMCVGVCVRVCVPVCGLLEEGMRPAVHGIVLQHG